MRLLINCSLCDSEVVSFLTVFKGKLAVIMCSAEKTTASVCGEDLSDASFKCYSDGWTEENFWLHTSPQYEVAVIWPQLMLTQVNAARLFLVVLCWTDFNQRVFKLKSWWAGVWSFKDAFSRVLREMWIYFQSCFTRLSPSVSDYLLRCRLCSESSVVLSGCSVKGRSSGH